ncbi:MAG TPA: hypothetical protein VF103_00610 [Polyangiaceae bacterium]
MAQSRNPMARIERLEGALVHITDLLVLQSERMDDGFSSLREEMQGMRREMQTTRQEMDGMRQSVQSVVDRLDRLMAVTTKERTSGVERLASIEARLAKLEEHAGI